MATAEIYVHAKKEHIWISKLREMPEGVFDTLVARIAKGDSLREISKYCASVKPLMFGINGKSRSAKN